MKLQLGLEGSPEAVAAFVQQFVAPHNKVLHSLAMETLKWAIDHNESTHASTPFGDIIVNLTPSEDCTLSIQGRLIDKPGNA